MNEGQDRTQTRPLTARRVVRGVGLATAAGALAWYGPWWFALGALFLVAVGFYSTPVLAAVLGQTGLVGLGSPSLTAVLLVESGILVALLAPALSLPIAWSAVVTTLLGVPLVGGLVWLGLTTTDVSPMLIGGSVLLVTGLVCYVLHRYLLLRIGALGDDGLARGDTR